VKATRTFKRSFDRFLDDPGSIRNAARLMILAMVAVVVAGGVVVWLFDHNEYPSFGRALWFTLQTVTTVGYGDVTPTSVVGRVVGGVVMLTAIAFITIVTAAITSTFVEAARRKAAEAAAADQTLEAEHTDDALALIASRLDRLEETLQTLVQQSGSAAPAADEARADSVASEPA
jgi:voltage-gated potassium channel